MIIIIIINNNSDNNPVQEDMHISKDKVEEQCRKMPNWKASGPDGVQGFWVKKLTACHQRIAEQRDKILNVRKSCLNG